MAKSIRRYRLFSFIQYRNDTYKTKKWFFAYIAILSLNLIWLKFYRLFLDAIPKNLPIIHILFSYHYTYDYITPINLLFMLYCWHLEEHRLDAYYANVVAICANISDAYSKMCMHKSKMKVKCACIWSVKVILTFP